MTVCANQIQTQGTKYTKWMKGSVIPYSAKLTNRTELNTALDWTESGLINSKSEMSRITTYVVS